MTTLYLVLKLSTKKTPEELKAKKAQYKDLEDLVYRFQLTYNENINKLDLKYISTKRTGFSLNPGIYEVVDLNYILKRFCPLMGK